MGGLGHESWRLICLKGNHEDIMWQTCRRKVPDCGWWLDNGGGATLISYGQNEGDQADVTVVLEEHLKWIDRLPLMHVDKHRIFVHAGVNPNYPLDEQDPQDVIWKIYDDRDEGGHGQRHIVHGHHQHAHGPILKKNRTNLDTLAMGPSEASKVARCAGADWHAPDDWKRKVVEAIERSAHVARVFLLVARADEGWVTIPSYANKNGPPRFEPLAKYEKWLAKPLLFCPPQICFRSSTKSASKLGMAQTTPDRAKSRNGGRWDAP